MKTFWPRLGICLGIFVVAIDWAIVNNALPSIQRDLGATIGELQWIVNAFGLAMSVLMVTMGRFADAYGRRRIFVLGLLVCVVSSIGAALSPSAGWLICFRSFQGVSNAMVITTSQSLITHVFPEEKHGKALGIWSTLVGLGIAMGPVFGGVIISIASWHWIFYFNLPFLLLSYIIVRLTVQESKNEEQSAKVDVPGLFFLVVGLGSLLMAIIQGPDWGWNSPLILGLFTIAVVFLISFYFVEHRVPTPLIRFELFKQKRFFAACMGNFSVIFLFWGIFFAVPLYFQNILDLTPFASGMYMLAISLPFAVVSHYAGPLGDKIEKKHLLLTGMAIAMIGAWVMTFFGVELNLFLIFASMILFGIGVGTVFGPSTSLGISSISRNYVGVASGALTTVQEIGGSVGLALVGTVIRSMEKVQLSTELQKEGVVLSNRMQAKIRSLLSSYEELTAYLSNQSAELRSQILEAFRASFMYGFEGGMWLCVGVVACTIISIFFMLRKAT